MAQTHVTAGVDDRVHGVLVADGALVWPRPLVGGVTGGPGQGGGGVGAGPWGSEEGDMRDQVWGRTREIELKSSSSSQVDFGQDIEPWTDTYLTREIPNIYDMWKYAMVECKNILWCF